MKLYYSISEMSQKFNVANSLLRYWEKEFPILRPSKNSNGERRYTAKDIVNIKLIYFLVKEKGYTIEGARNELKNNKPKLKARFKLIEKLKKSKTELEALKEKLDNYA